MNEQKQVSVNEAASSQSDLNVRLAAETKRADQLGFNCAWLIAKIDRIHAALCAENGTWQMRAEQAVEAAEKIKGANVQIVGQAASGLSHSNAGLCVNTTE